MMKSRPSKKTVFPGTTSFILCATLIVLGTHLTGDEIVLELERSANLSDWEPVTITADMLTDEGSIRLTTTETEEFFRLRVTEFSELDPAANMALIPAGTFTMGSPSDEPDRGEDEGPQYSATLTRDFQLQKTSVTWRQWRQVRSWAVENGYTDLAPGQKGSHGDSRNSDEDPVTHVSWYDAVKWLNALTEMDNAMNGGNLEPVYTADGDVYRTGQLGSEGSGAVQWTLDAGGYRLPTEAEWEYAARAGTTTAFYSGPITYTGWEQIDPNLDPIAWYRGNANQTHPVGEKLPNEFDLFDLSGNVWDWCWDFHDEYPSRSATDPTGPDSGVNRVMRGGSWNNRAGLCRSATRLAIRGADWTGPAVGFRPARNATQ